MMRSAKPVTRERLMERVSYDPETGLFCWKTSHGRSMEGKPAHSEHKDGYIHFVIDGLHILAHRAAWVWMTGEWPERLDHINGVRSDNRFCNLRLATNSENRQNMTIKSKGESGVVGVHRHGRKWRAAIRIDHKRFQLGTYVSIEEAHKAYLAAKAVLHTFAPVPREAAQMTHPQPLFVTG